MSTVTFRKPAADAASDLLGRLDVMRASIFEIARQARLDPEAGQAIREPLADLGAGIGALAADLARLAEEKRS